MLRLVRSQPKSIPSMDMTPMIDMVFQLLVFFLLTSIFASQPVLNLMLPEAKSAKNDDQERTICLSIQKEGRVFIDQEEIPMGELRSALLKWAEKDQKKSILLSADQDVPFRIFVSVLDVIQNLGLLDLAIVTRTTESEVGSRLVEGLP